jgi:hypothetical protein
MRDPAFVDLALPVGAAEGAAPVPVVAVAAAPPTKAVVLQYSWALYDLFSRMVLPSVAEGQAETMQLFADY